MPVRNIVTFLLVLLVSIACYVRAPQNRYANIMAEAIDIVEQQSLQVVPRRELFKSAMQGMLRSIDSNSSFLSDEVYERINEDIRQEFAGVGLRVQMDPETELLTVVRPIPGTPAYLAGLQPGDVILEVDGESTYQVPTNDAVSKIRGPLGQPLTLLIQRGDNEPIPVRLIRANIPLPSVYGDWVNEQGNWVFVLESHPRIGYIRLDRFGDRSVREMEEALASIRDRVDAVILDLRSNYGGVLDGAIAVSDLFLPDNLLIVSTRGRGGVVLQEHYSTSGQSLDDQIPLVVLINRRSASASEIVAASLQDHRRAVIIGEQSFGKGTVQNLIPLERGRSFIKLTVASYWRPNNQNIERSLAPPDRPDEWGVRPNPGFDIEQTQDEVNLVELTRLQRDFEQNGVRLPDPTSDFDPQGEVDDDEKDTQADSPRDERLDESSLPANLDALPRWEEVDRPLNRAIEYLQQQTQRQAI